MIETPAIETSTAHSELLGAHGEVVLGEQFAGRQVLVEEREPGVWLIRTQEAISDDEWWTQDPKAMSDLRTALEWAQKNPPKETNLDALVRKLNEAA